MLKAIMRGVLGLYLAFSPNFSAPLSHDVKYKGKTYKTPELYQVLNTPGSFEDQLIRVYGDPVSFFQLPNSRGIAVNLVPWYDKEKNDSSYVSLTFVITDPKQVDFAMKNGLEKMVEEDNTSPIGAYGKFMFRKLPSNDKTAFNGAYPRIVSNGVNMKPLPFIHSRR